MNNKIMKIINNIKEFLRNLFKKSDLMLNKPQANNGVNSNKNNVKINTIQQLKNENKRNRTIQEIIDITEKNPENLKNLDIEQLKLIDNYYVEKNAKMKEQLNSLYKKIDIVKKDINALNRVIDKYELKSNS